MKSLIAILLLLGPASFVWAEEQADTKEPLAITTGLFVDTYYSYNFTNSAKGQNGSGNIFYGFVDSDNSYTLGLAELTVLASKGPASAQIILMYGRDADSLEVLDPLATDGTMGILQATLAYKAGPWTFTFGKMVTHMGFETIESKGNWNYSRSLLFQLPIPAYHTGFSVNYAPEGPVSSTFYVYNGWNGAMAFNLSQEKTYGLQTIVKLDEPKMAITLNGIIGPNPDFPGYLTDSSTRAVFDGIFTWEATNKFSLALNIDHGIQAVPSGPGLTYWGAALYGHYQFESDWALALRLEEYNDRGYTFKNSIPFHTTPDLSGAIREATLTLEHKFTDNLLTRIEGRYDVGFSDGVVFKPGDGPYADGSPDQWTGSVGMILNF